MQERETSNFQKFKFQISIFQFYFVVVRRKAIENTIFEIKVSMKLKTISENAFYKIQWNNLPFMK